MNIGYQKKASYKRVKIIGEFALKELELTWKQRQSNLKQRYNAEINLKDCIEDPEDKLAELIKNSLRISRIHINFTTSKLTSVSSRTQTEPHFCIVLVKIKSLLNLKLIPAPLKRRVVSSPNENHKYKFFQNGPLYLGLVAGYHF